jgi:hypothetical protein
MARRNAAVREIIKTKLARGGRKITRGALIRNSRSPRTKARDRALCR